MMWTSGFSDSGKRFQGADGQNTPAQEHALRFDWRTLPMPRERAEIDLMLPLSAAEFETLAHGHIPHAMEDHWFMYFDGDAFCFHRSWTGYCIFQVHVEHAEEGFVLTGVTANRDCSQYTETSDERDRLMATILVAEALGKDATELWEAVFAREHSKANNDSMAAQGPIGFWKETEAYGFCSNWYPASFYLFNMPFKTSEHWMMWQKARVMGDFKKADEILAAPSAERAKDLGKQAKPYDEKLWHDVREQLVTIGVREKFLQNPDIARKLMETGSAVLAEASPKDNVWGVGISVDDPGFSDMTGWKGDNLLGRVCMQVRSDLWQLVEEGAGRIACRTEDDDIQSVLRSDIGAQSLLALTRNPITRKYAMTYVRIAQYHSSRSFPTQHAFLMGRGQQSIADIDQRSGSGNAASNTPVGWREFLIQLAFLRRTGVL